VRNKAYAALLAGSTLWNLSILAAPLFALPVVYQFFSIICHQDPARSLHVLGEPLAVCTRCTGIYFGFAASLWLGLHMNARWLRFAFVLAVAEFVFARVVLDAGVVRGLSGMLLGLCAAPFVRQGVEELSESM
jgi:uncharacterized membrane protein